MEAESLTSLDPFAELLGRLPPGMDLDQLALEHKAIQRKRAIDSGADLLRLALARGPGGKSLRETAAWATLTGLAEISNPGLKLKLDNAVEFLAAIVSGLLATRSESLSLHWPGRHLRLADGTCISQPGSQGTDWRVHGVYDLGRGGFSHLEVTDAQGSEHLNRGAPIAGEVRIADRGFSTAAALDRFRRESDGQADFIVRMRWGSFRLLDPNGQAFDLIQHLKALPPEPAVHEIMVQAVVKNATVLPLRLVILRKSPTAAEATGKRLRQAASRMQRKLDPRSLIAAQFILLATSLPADIEACDILAAYRLRWQIELAFKRMKSLMRIDKLPTLTKRGSQSWLYAHLILVLLSDTLSQDILDSPP